MIVAALRDKSYQPTKNYQDNGSRKRKDNWKSKYNQWCRWFYYLLIPFVNKAQENFMAEHWKQFFPLDSEPTCTADLIEISCDKTGVSKGHRVQLDQPKPALVEVPPGDLKRK